MTLEKGKTYATRNGKKYTPELVNNGTNYRWQARNPDGTFELWLDSGFALGEGCPTPRDLIEQVETAS